MRWKYEHVRALWDSGDINVSRLACESLHLAPSDVLEVSYGREVTHKGSPIRGSCPLDDRESARECVAGTANVVC